MRKIIPIIFFVLCSFLVLAQTKYIKPIYSASQVAVMKDFVYSNANWRHKMDIYYPTANTDKDKPVILLIHGGGFVGGDKSYLTNAATYIAMCGYVAVTMNYRLIQLDQICTEISWWWAVQDAHAALRCLSYYHNNLGIDPNNICILGSSAGAITALTLTFTEDEDLKNYYKAAYYTYGGLDYSTDPLYRGSKYNISGIVSLSGGMPEIIQKIGYDFEKTPVLFIHGEDDETVPINYGPSILCPNGPTLYGPIYLITHQPIKIPSLPSKLIPVINEGHIINMEAYPTQILDFLYNKTQIESSTNLKSTISETYSEQSFKLLTNEIEFDFSVSPNPTSGNFNIRIMSILGGDAGVLVYDMLGKEHLRSSFQLNNGINELSFETNLKRGIYIVTIHLNGKTGNKKLIVQ